MVVPFTPEFASQSPKDYIEDFLIKYFKPKAVVIGYDHQFGKGRVGTKDILLELQSIYHYEVYQIDAFEIDGTTVSSTKIRNALSIGDFDLAKNYWVIHSPYQAGSCPAIDWADRWDFQLPIS